MQVTVPSSAETQLTGWIGTVEQTIRNTVYAVRFQIEDGKASAKPSKNGAACEWTPTLLRLCKSGARLFSGSPQSSETKDKPYRCPRGISSCQCGAEYCRNRR